MKNKFEIRGEATAIIINSPKYGIMETLIDTSDLPIVDSYEGSWFVSFYPSINGFYIVGSVKTINGKRSSINLHRMVMGFPKNINIDHINHNTLDNRRNVNLREATRAENQQNLLKSRSDSKSGVLGVHWHKGEKKWRAQITLNGKRIQLGSFDILGEAETVVIEARKKYMPFSQEAI